MRDRNPARAQDFKQQNNEMASERDSLQSPRPLLLHSPAITGSHRLQPVTQIYGPDLSTFIQVKVPSPPYKELDHGIFQEVSPLSLSHLSIRARVLQRYGSVCVNSSLLWLFSLLSSIWQLRIEVLSNSIDFQGLRGLTTLHFCENLSLICVDSSFGTV